MRTQAVRGGGVTRHPILRKTPRGQGVCGRRMSFRSGGDCEMIDLMIDGGLAVVTFISALVRTRKQRLRLVA